MADTRKSQAIAVISRLGDNASYEDILYEIYFCARVERGIKEAEEGKLVPHDEVVKRMSKWLQSSGQ